MQTCLNCLPSEAARSGPFYGNVLCLFSFVPSTDGGRMYDLVKETRRRRIHGCAKRSDPQEVTQWKVKEI